MITGTMNIAMTLEKANYYNVLEKRDKAMPAVKGAYTFEGTEHKYYKCPVCGEYLYAEDFFCRSCGQRIDTENNAL